MTDLFTPARQVASVKFKWEKGDRVYDYFVPSGLIVTVGDKVVVETKRGEADVEVVAIKAESEMAEKSILRKCEPVAAPTEPTVPATEGYNF